MLRPTKLADATFPKCSEPTSPVTAYRDVIHLLYDALRRAGGMARVFVPEQHSPKSTTRKHQPNSNRSAFYKITGRHSFRARPGQTQCKASCRSRPEQTGSPPAGCVASAWTSSGRREQHWYNGGSSNKSGFINRSVSVSIFWLRSHTEVRQHGNTYRSLVKGLWEFYDFRDIFFRLTLLQSEGNKRQSQGVSSTCHFLSHFSLESHALRGAHHEMEKPGALSHWMNPASLSPCQPEGNFT